MRISTSVAGPPSPWAERLRVPAAILATVLGAALLALLLFTLVDVVQSRWLPWAMLPLTGVPFVVTVLSVRARSADLSFGGLPVPVSGWRARVVSIGFGLCWLVAMVSFFTGPVGNAERDGDRYVLVSRGEEREVSEAEWSRAANSQVRFVGSIGLAFCLVSAVYLTSPEAKRPPSYSTSTQGRRP